MATTSPSPRPPVARHLTDIPDGAARAARLGTPGAAGTIRSTAGHPHLVDARDGALVGGLPYNGAGVTATDRFLLALRHLVVGAAVIPAFVITSLRRP
ncbi:MULTISPECIES: hypothetical protein [unclassified Streptomyces]|uniref:hypothetical protein n=1 Tax=unclassified Streptomyces TaxID=2593676 RepID=UPI00131D574D|nr:hypothetical protein [Streptomyces sp. NRRL F-2747]